MGQAKERRMMVGSGGQLDYYIVATKDGGALGIKFLLESNFINKMLGLRVRFAKDTDSDMAMPNYGEIAKHTLPHMPWETSSHHRASFTCGVPMPPKPGIKVSALMQKVLENKLIDQLVEILYDKTVECGYDMMFTHEELTALMMEQFAAKLSTYYLTEEEVAGKPEIGKLIKFPGHKAAEESFDDDGEPEPDPNELE